MAEPGDPVWNLPGQWVILTQDLAFPDGRTLSANTSAQIKVARPANQPGVLAVVTVDGTDVAVFPGQIDCAPGMQPTVAEPSFEDRMQGKQSGEVRVLFPDRDAAAPRELPEITPAVDMLRSYQRELFDYAKEENTILFCPTGSGKTVIAWAVAEQVLLQKERAALQRNSAAATDQGSPGCVVFAAHRVALLEQQYRKFREQQQRTGQTRRVTLVHSGRPMSNDWSQMVQWFDYIFIMASILCDRCDRRAASLDQVSLLIFDECHHTKDRHPYAMLLHKHYWSLVQPKRPQILGLTASPCTGRHKEIIAERVLDLCELMDCKIVTVNKGDNRRELHSHCVPAEPHKQIIQQDKWESQMEAELVQLAERAEQLIVRGDFRSTLLDEHSDIDRQADMRQFREKMEKMGPAGFTDRYYDYVEECRTKASAEARPGLAAAYALLQGLCQALQLLDEVGVHEALEVWKERSADIAVLVATITPEPMPLEHAAGEQEQRDHAIAQENHTLLKAVSAAFQDATARIGPYHHYQDQSPKLTYMLGLLRDEFTRLPEPRVLLFMSTKLGCQRMEATLTQLRDEELQRDKLTPLGKVEPKMIVGHGNVRNLRREGQTVTGLSVQQQTDILQHFDAGNINVLIATTVVEEGIDIAACSCVIRYDTSTNLTALIQSRGRARFENSRFYNVIRPHQETAFDNLRLEEDMMDTVVRQFMDVPPKPTGPGFAVPWYAPGGHAVRLLEQYFANELFWMDSQGTQVPNFSQSRAVFRDSGSRSLVQGYRCTLQLPIVGAYAAVARGTGLSERQALHECALDACRMLHVKSLLKPLADGTTHHRMRRTLTWYQTADFGVTTNKGVIQPVLVYRRSQWMGNTSPFAELVVELSKNKDRFLPITTTYAYAEGCTEGQPMRICEITLRQHTATGEILSDSFRGMEPSETDDEARHTTALDILSQVFHKQFFQQHAPDEHARGLTTVEKVQSQAPVQHGISWQLHRKPSGNQVFSFSVGPQIESSARRRGHLREVGPHEADSQAPWRNSDCRSWTGTDPRSSPVSRDPSVAGSQVGTPRTAQTPSYGHRHQPGSSAASGSYAGGASQPLRTLPQQNAEGGFYGPEATLTARQREVLGFVREWGKQQLSWADGLQDAMKRNQLATWLDKVDGMVPAAGQSSSSRPFA
eukprot:TRINITY_DN46903_c0_g1_i1.p1 TRINITY_DN46903_c0_g1~~TRINITY_DN46903_c0_g1_i1.p1  ORF type:complete len:1195 (+),score=337.83 TRINITY_DN46903_c0_g1_i1:94-3585(+)